MTRAISFADAQFSYDSAQPADDSLRDAAIKALTDRLNADMWQDLEHLSDALDDAVYRLGNYKRGRPVHTQCVKLLTLIREGSDDAALGQMLRVAAKDYISRTAGDAAEERLGS